ncbi:ankyrin repeat and protein kinase domain-containing protein 1-like [Homalodisca vitripennis]|uniref:ankyrin repeat and protein kinase domain-containing protein 1-like n=1 Tax=Homalodisca vitripennis TaxID=197043 RepID=UPI001EECDCBB|nr:ankyrin repeat and protein kinase domain-containing protein 1-like [Homalodisca vitripennis]
MGFNLNSAIHQETGWSILHYAVKSTDFQFVKFLLSVNADPNNTDKKGRTPLHYSVSKNLSAYVKLLIKHGADPNRECNEHLTPTALAVAEDNSEMLTLLISLGADPDRIVELDGQQVTPLQLAVNVYNFKNRTAVVGEWCGSRQKCPRDGRNSVTRRRTRPSTREKTADSSAIHVVHIDCARRLTRDDTKR